RPRAPPRPLPQRELPERRARRNSSESSKRRRRRPRRPQRKPQSPAVVTQGHPTPLLLSPRPGACPMARRLRPRQQLQQR
ncbi:unnamed protein product, partial [Ectocarpus sp. 8 AP-2014]